MDHILGRNEVCVRNYWDNPLPDHQTGYIAIPCGTSCDLSAVPNLPLICYLINTCPLVPAIVKSLFVVAFGSFSLYQDFLD